MNIEQAMSKALKETFDDSDNIYITTSNHGVIANIESGSVPAMTPTSQDKWLRVQNLTQIYSGLDVYLEPINDAQIIAYEV